MTVQIIKKFGKPEYALIPYAEYQELLEMAQASGDLGDADLAMAELLFGEDESIPGVIANRLISGTKTGSANIFEALVDVLRLDVDDFMR